MKTKHEIIRKPWPVFDERCAGKYYIQPIEAFTAKGYHWSKRIEWELKSVAIPLSESRTLAYCGWQNPKVTQEMGDMVRLENGDPCMCEDCVSGRKEVEAGWTPWGKHFGFPS